MHGEKSKKTSEIPLPIGNYAPRRWKRPHSDANFSLQNPSEMLEPIFNDTSRAKRVVLDAAKTHTKNRCIFQEAKTPRPNHLFCRTKHTSAPRSACFLRKIRAHPTNTTCFAAPNARRAPKVLVFTSKPLEKHQNPYSGVLGPKPPVEVLIVTGPARCAESAGK